MKFALIDGNKHLPSPKLKGIGALTASRYEPQRMAAASPHLPSYRIEANVVLLLLAKTWQLVLSSKYNEIALYGRLRYWAITGLCDRLNDHPRPQQHHDHDFWR